MFEPSIHHSETLLAASIATNKPTEILHSKKLHPLAIS
jgi:hypothetical protein